jgi:ABC-type lipoprotein release transport system permease subunit
MVLAIAGTLAAWIPARRASSITPLVALRRD